ncbi:MAG: hypothetical protein EBU01_15510, partial [Crocinitomicaceae bacterium]|nr:hypothetical protein [Crocinitomicaceae bacterium]
GERVEPAGHEPPRHVDRPATDLFGRDPGGSPLVADRLLLELTCKYARPVVEVRVVRVLNRAVLAIWVEARLPRDETAVVHRGPVGEVEVVGLSVGTGLVAYHVLGKGPPECRVLLEPHVVVASRPVPHHRDPLALPRRVFAGVEQLVDHVAVLNHRRVDHAGHAGRVAREFHHALQQDLHAGLALHRAAGTVACLRIVDDANVWTQLPAVWSFPAEAEDRSGEAAAHDDRTARR